MAGRWIFHYSIPALQGTGNGQIEEGATIDSTKTLIGERCVLVSKLNPRKGTVCVAEPHPDYLTVASSELIPLVSRSGGIEYVHYVVQSSPYRDRLASRVESATRSHQRVGVDDILKFTWAFPPPEEQKGITRFLNRETAKIDALVAEQERLIALLQEKRLAVISHAVTKGLDPNVPMKDSGMDWIGAVPTSWTRARADAMMATSSRVVQPSEMADQEVYHYSIPALQESGDGVLEDGATIDSAKTLIDERCVLVSKLNPRKGTVCIARPHSPYLTVSSGELIPLVPYRASVDYVYYLVQSSPYRDRLSSRVESATRSHQRASVDDVTKFPWVFPPLEEQISIAAFLDHETTKTGTAVRAAEEGITLLRERRAALITAAVTGQIDVRGLVEAA